MEPLIVLAVTFALLWVLFILPQQRRVRAHQALVDAVRPGDHVVLSAGIHGRIVDLGPEELTLEVAPGVELRVARQAVLRRIEHATELGTGEPAHEDRSTGDERSTGSPDPGDLPFGEGGTTDAGSPGAADEAGPDDRGPSDPGPHL